MTSLKSKIKAVFLGQQSTGKTSILTRFIEDKFEVGLNATVGIDFMAKTVVVNGQVLRMQFWDTAGQQRFRSLIPNYLKQAAIAFLVFDVTNDKSFVNLPQWIDLCYQNMGQKCVTLLLANKCDLIERQITKQEIEVKAKQYNLKFYEVSAKTGLNIKEALNAACQQLIQRHKIQPKSDPQSSKNETIHVLNNKGKPWKTAKQSNQAAQVVTTKSLILDAAEFIYLLLNFSNILTFQLYNILFDLNIYTMNKTSLYQINLFVSYECTKVNGNKFCQYLTVSNIAIYYQFEFKKENSLRVSKKIIHIR